MSQSGQSYRPPDVFVTEADFERLTNLSLASGGPSAAVLAEELERAIVVADEAAAGHPFARLNDRVEFIDLLTGRSRCVELVAPDEADIDRDRLSVLTPVGAALIGLAPGASIGLKTADGRSRVLVVVDVERGEAEAATSSSQAPADQRPACEPVAP